MIRVSRRAFNLAATGILAVPRSAWAASDDVPKSLDHVILGCSDLDAGVEYVYARTGIRAAAGGVHPGAGTKFASVLQNDGLESVGPKPGSRARPDGTTLSWASLTLKNDDDGVLPFFIDWGSKSRHPSVDAPTGCRLTDLWIAAPDPAALHALTAKLQLEVQIRQANELRLAATIVGPKGSLRLLSR
ncbi:MAG TPA: VOC family protein [Steroidobacteraceae bacterium]